jgi:glyoxylase-like metal-dependent hydrolase (beta-lactamase superfamily II)
MSGHTSSNDFISTRTIGEATVSIINEGSFLWHPNFPVPEEEWRAAAPDADDHGRVRPEVNACLIQIGGANILIDPGMDGSDSVWRERLTQRFPEPVFTPGLLAGLRHLGVLPGEITHVVLTHAHFDHIAGLTIEQDRERVPKFSNATHLIHQADWDGNSDRDKPDSEVVRSLVPIDEAGLLTLVQDGHEIVPGVSIIHAPGESPGHSIVRLETAGETFYYLGDVVHHAAEVEHIDWIPPLRDRDATIATRKRVFAEAADSGALVVPSHERFPPWGHIVRAGNGFRWVRD